MVNSWIIWCNLPYSHQSLHRMTWHGHTRATSSLCLYMCARDDIYTKSFAIFWLFDEQLFTSALASWAALVFFFIHFVEFCCARGHTLTHGYTVFARQQTHRGNAVNVFNAHIFYYFFSSFLAFYSYEVSVFCVVLLFFIAFDSFQRQHRQRFSSGFLCTRTRSMGVSECNAFHQWYNDDVERENETEKINKKNE